jgi:heat shock protein HslJ
MEKTIFAKERKTGIFQDIEMKAFKVIITVIVFLILVVFKTKIEAAPILAISTTIDSTSKTLFPDTTNWVLVKVPENKTMKQHTGAKVFIRINTTKNTVSGYTSCNSIKGKVMIKDSTILFTEVVGGERVCDERTMEMEKLFKVILQKSNSWKISDNMLYLYENSTLILEFKMENEK